VCCFQGKCFFFLIRLSFQIWVLSLPYLLLPHETFTRNQAYFWTYILKAWRRRQHNTPKHWYLRTILHAVTN
jgi:hypothetical protein